MNYILFDGNTRNQLLPFTYTRPVADIRCGILTLREKWEHFLGNTTSSITEDYLSEKFPLVEFEENIVINGAIIPNQELVDNITVLTQNQSLYHKDVLIAFFSIENQEVVLEDLEKIQYNSSIRSIEHTWDIFSLNGAEISSDFKLLTEGKTSQKIPSHVFSSKPENIFIEEGVVLEHITLNANDGVIYIGKNSKILDGSLIRGPFALCEGAIVKMGAKIYKDTTIGPNCKAGGEINNTVMFANSNKGHDGYLGNAVIGEWCNIGAGSNNSNLKNDYSEVKLWSYETERFQKTGLQFCGLMMGDHSKCAIDTQFNTGTVIGVFANIFGFGFPKNFIPSFTWGGKQNLKEYNTKKAFEVAAMVMQRRKQLFSDTEKNMLSKVFNITKTYRTKL
jgi:UDP-N-acetylglucosamine diphosphorylase/glucosamine-1-phosphate N-acetyltransferase